jgi:hypothetical protein
VEQYFYPQIDQECHANANTVYFQQNGAPPHFALITRQSLSDTFCDRWIDRGGPID